MTTPRSRLSWLALSVVLVLIPLSPAVFGTLLLRTHLRTTQKRFSSGELKGFTKSPTEHIITHLKHPFVVREVRGTILRAVGDKSPLAKVLFELRGPGDRQAIQSATTAPDGTFRITGVRPGKYLFKATTSGFQSIVGEVIVSSKAARGRTIRLHMRPGV